MSPWALFTCLSRALKEAQTATPSDEEQGYASWFFSGAAGLGYSAVSGAVGLGQGAVSSAAGFAGLDVGDEEGFSLGCLAMFWQCFGDVLVVCR